MGEASEFLMIKGFAAPAQRALAGAGFTKVSELQAISAKDLAQLHGMGPKALKVLSEEP